MADISTLRIGKAVIEAVIEAGSHCDVRKFIHISCHTRIYMYTSLRERVTKNGEKTEDIICRLLDI